MLVSARGRVKQHTVVFKSGEPLALKGRAEHVREPAQVQRMGHIRQVKGWPGGAGLVQPGLAGMKKTSCSGGLMCLTRSVAYQKGDGNAGAVTAGHWGGVTGVTGGMGVAVVLAVMVMEPYPSG
jgi:hypothetical protein